MSQLHNIYALFALVLGACLGSFANVAISRWPDDRSVVKPASACPACDQPVAPRDNIPMVSWLLLGARCRHCQWPIPATYPLTELLVALIGWLMYRRIVATPLDLDLAHGLAFGQYLVFATGLVIGSMIDVRHKILPDPVTQGLIPVGVLGIATLGVLGYGGPLGLTWKTSVLGALCGGLLFGLMALGAYFATGREALGIGDVKLMAMIGAFTGPKGVYAISLSGSLLGALAGLVALLVLRRRTFLPFGPWLSVAAIAWVLFGS